jgi:serine/threonine protein kinase
MQLTIHSTGHVYEIDENLPPLGVGTYSEVYRARRILPPPLPSEPRVVAKFTDLKHEGNYQTWLSETAIFERLQALPPHPHLVQCFGKAAWNGFGILILERFVGVPLEKHIETHGALSETDAVHVLKQIVSALKFLHAQHIVFNDLKIENIGYDAVTRRIKLFDFGLSGHLSHRDIIVEDTRGTPLTMSPEKLFIHLHNPFQSEMWSLGQIIYHICAGQFMFWSCNNIRDLKNEMKRCRSEAGVKTFLVATRNLSENIRSVIQNLCTYDPKLRWTVDQTETWFFRTYPEEQKKKLTIHLLEKEGPFPMSS